MDIALLAQSATNLLMPVLPYLLKPADHAAEEVAKRFGGAAWETAASLWAKLRPAADDKPALREAVEDAAAAPDDADAAAALRIQLKKLLTDQALAREIAEILERGASGAAVTASGRGVAIGSSVSGSTIVTGDRNRIR